MLLWVYLQQIVPRMRSVLVAGDALNDSGVFLLNLGYEKGRAFDLLILAGHQQFPIDEPFDGRFWLTRYAAREL